MRMLFFLPPLPACGERVGVRGTLRDVGESWTRGESPSPGSHFMRSDLSPRAGRGKRHSLLERDGVHQAALAPGGVEAARELQGAVLADIALEDLAVIAGRLDRLLH